eukprot:3564039-Amphidinium_carterae.1
MPMAPSVKSIRESSLLREAVVPLSCHKGSSRKSSRVLLKTVSGARDCNMRANIAAILPHTNGAVFNLKHSRFHTTTSDPFG